MPDAKRATAGAIDPRACGGCGFCLRAFLARVAEVAADSEPLAVTGVAHRASRTALAARCVGAHPAPGAMPRPLDFTRGVRVTRVFRRWGAEAALQPCSPGPTSHDPPPAVLWTCGAIWAGHPLLAGIDGIGPAACPRQGERADGLAIALRLVAIERDGPVRRPLARLGIDQRMGGKLDPAR